MSEAEEEVEEADHRDDLGQMLHDEGRDFSGTDKEFMMFQRLLEDHKTLFYPDCQEGHKKLRSTLELLQCKDSNGVTDKAFEEL